MSVESTDRLDMLAEKIADDIIRNGADVGEGARTDL
jgi:hypothetical protein